MLQNSLVTVSEIIIQPPSCIEIIQNGKNITIGTLGNFSLVIGKAKQGKTFVVSMALAAAENGIPFNDILKVSLPPEKRKIILFDTEQSKYHVQKVLKRICKMADKTPPENLIVYSLRSRSPDERLKMIEVALQTIDNVGLVVIDGIRDLVTSINDEEQSTLISSKLLKWTEELNIHIMTVLHMNKGDQNARGHLGTELTNKSETVISVARAGKEKDTIEVKAEYTRDKDFEPWAFKIDNFGIPSIIKDWSNDNNVVIKTKAFRFNPKQIPREKYVEIIKRILLKNPNQKRTEFINNLKMELDFEFDQTFKESHVLNVLKYCMESGIVITTGITPHTNYRLVQELPFNTTE